MAENKITLESDKNFKLIGIASAERDYKLCYMLSEALGWQITRLPNHDIETKDRSLKASFSAFKVIDEPTVATHYLFGNKSLSDLLLPEAGNFDYLLKMSGSFKGTKDILKKLKLIPSVLTASEIAVKALKNHDRLAYEEPVEESKKVVKRRNTPTRN